MTPGVTEPAEAAIWQELGQRGSHAALQLAIRSVILRGLTFVGTITLARLLAPADFGVYGIVAFVVAVWTSLGDFGLGAALVQQAEKPSPAQLRTAWTVQQLIALSAVVMIWLAAPALTGLVSGLPSDTPWMLRVLALGLLMSSLRTLPAVMMERDLRFGPLAAAEVVQQITFYSVAVALAVAHAGAWAFVLAGIAQLAMGALVVNLAWRHRPGIGIDRACLKSMFGFGFAYQSSIIVLTLRDAPLPALVGLVSGTVAAGLIQFAFRLALTIATIDELVARIAFPAFSRLQGHPQQQARALDVAVLMTGLVLVPAQCWIAALAPVLVPIVFGSQWTEAILPLQLMCLATLLRFPARYLRQAEFADGATRRGLGMSIATTALALAGFVVGLLWWGLPGCTLGFLAGSALGLWASMRLARDIPGLSWGRLWLMFGAGLAAGAGSTVTLIATGQVAIGAALPVYTLASSALPAILATAVFAAICMALLAVTNCSALAVARRLAGLALGRGTRS
jgi:O-antigen/teichoic acid export membrane protein